MLIVGLVSLAQIVYLPGALVLRLIGLRNGGAFEKILLSFGLSLLVNTWLVTLFVGLGLYSRPVLWITIVSEILALLFLSYTRGPRKLYLGSDYSIEKSTWLFENAASSLGFVAAAATIIIFFYIFYLNWGTVFSENDDVASWDRWAVEWAHALLPTRTSWYPQLIPTNWSISYVLLGRTDIKMFAKATTVMYPIMTLFAFFSLAKERRDPAFLIGAGAFGWILLHYLGISFMMIGYADVPLAFFAFLTFYVAYRSKGPALRQDLLLCLLFSIGALLTKQGGVYVVVIALLYAGWRRRSHGEESTPATERLAVITLFAFCFAAAWFGYKLGQVHSGVEYSNLSVLTHLQHGPTPFDRFISAGKMFWTFRGTGGPPVALLFAGLLVGSLFDPKARWVTLLLIAPFLAVWGFTINYEIRNASLVFPFVGFISGVVAGRILDFLSIPLNRVQLGPVKGGPLGALLFVTLTCTWILVGEPGLHPFLPRQVGTFLTNDWIRSAFELYALPGVMLGGIALVALAPGTFDFKVRIFWPIPATLAIVAIVFLSMFKYTPEALSQSQLALQRRIGTPSVDERLYATFAARNSRQPILTDYWFLQALPGLEDLFRRLPCGAPCSYENLKSAARLVPEAGYILIHDTNLDRSRLDQFGTYRGFEPVFDVSGVRLMRLHRSDFDHVNRPPQVLGGRSVLSNSEKSLVTLFYSDPDGVRDIASATVIINDAPVGAHACYLEWYRSTNTAVIANDDGKGWAAEGKVGSTQSIHNSQCDLDLAGTSVSESSKDLEFTVLVRFAPSFHGSKHLYTAATDVYQLNSGYRELPGWELK